MSQSGHRASRRLPGRFRFVALLVMALGALLVPATAYAATRHWANPGYAEPGGAYADYNSSYLQGVYCHELDTLHDRNIQISAYWGVSNVQYGSWVTYTIAGLRSYAGQYDLSGACRNPHSVAYYFNAHDNY